MWVKTKPKRDEVQPGKVSDTPASVQKAMSSGGSGSNGTMAHPWLLVMMVIIVCLCMNTVDWEYPHSPLLHIYDVLPAIRCGGRRDIRSADCRRCNCGNCWHVGDGSCPRCSFNSSIALTAMSAGRPKQDVFQPMDSALYCPFELGPYAGGVSKTQNQVGQQHLTTLLCAAYVESVVWDWIFAAVRTNLQVVKVLISCQ